MNFADIIGRAGRGLDLIGRYGGYVNPTIGLISRATPDLGLSERAESYGGTYGSNSRPPEVLGAQAPQNTQNYQPVADLSNATSGFGSILNNYDRATSNNRSTGGQPSGQPSGQQPGDNGFGKLNEAARRAYETGVGNLQNALRNAEGIYNESKSALEKKRERFGELYDQGKGDILDSYQEQAGTLQRSSQGEEQRSANALRALGLGGSAAVRSRGRLAQDRIRALGGLQKERSINDRELNQQNADRLDWANAQESALDRNLNTARSAFDSGLGQLDVQNLTNEGQIEQQMAQYLADVNAQNQALQAVSGGIGSYQTNPFAVNVSDYTNALNSNQSGTDGQGTADPNAGVNITQPDLLSMVTGQLDPNKRSGLFGGGLYFGL